MFINIKLAESSESDAAKTSANISPGASLKYLQKLFCGCLCTWDCHCAIMCKLRDSVDIVLAEHRRPAPDFKGIQDLLIVLTNQQISVYFPSRLTSSLLLF